MAVSYETEKEKAEHIENYIYVYITIKTHK